MATVSNQCRSRRVDGRAGLAKVQIKVHCAMLYPFPITREHNQNACEREDNQKKEEDEQEQDVGLGMRAHAQCASCMTVLLWQYRVKVAEYLSLPYR